MAKPFDAGVRVLIDQYLPDWLTISSRSSHGAVRVIDSDLSTITAEADKLLFVDDPRPWILHLEPQANWDGKLEDRVCWYNNIVGYKHDCLVHSVIVLLRREADSPRLTGEYLQAFSGELPYRVFRYQIVRVWQMSANALVNGPWGLFPLAPLCDDAKSQLPGLFEKMANRLQAEVHDPQKIVDALGSHGDLVGPSTRSRNHLSLDAKGDDHGSLGRSKIARHVCWQGYSPNYFCARQAKVRAAR